MASSRFHPAQGPTFGDGFFPKIIGGNSRLAILRRVGLPIPSYPVAMMYLVSMRGIHKVWACTLLWREYTLRYGDDISYDELSL